MDGAHAGRPETAGPIRQDIIVRSAEPIVVRVAETLTLATPRVVS
jgi:hypothetical protein